MIMSLNTKISEFVQNVVNAMGLGLTATVEETPEATRINLEGEDGGVLIRRGGEGLQALQHIVATAFRKQLGDDHRIVIDCMGYRRDKDAELRQMARFMADKARTSGAPRPALTTPEPPVPWPSATAAASNATFPSIFRRTIPIRRWRERRYVST